MCACACVGIYASPSPSYIYKWIDGTDETTRLIREGEYRLSFFSVCFLIAVHPRRLIFGEFPGFS